MVVHIWNASSQICGLDLQLFKYLLWVFYLSFLYDKKLQAPRTSRQSLVKGRAHANAVAQQALIAHWQSIVNSLNNYLKIMKANYVSSEV